MSVDGVRVLGAGRPYADGAEDALLAVLTSAADRSTASDELAAHITDWPTRYHLSRLRANLLRPLRFRPGMRVLDVGSGTGVMARYAAEQGAAVVAVEGTLARARATRARCAGMGSVEVVCGALDDFADDEFADDRGFDCVLCIGVLEYAGPDHRAFLDRLRSLTRPGGTLVLAIENQLGLKYLLGYGEDHLGEPWAGVEGYRGQDRVRTFSRRELAGMLSAAGFGEQRWLFPFPDYKTPTVVLHEAAYEVDDAEVVVDQLVRWPCDASASSPARVCDDRFAHRTFLRAGLGADVANSFLVVAGGDMVAPGTLAWSYGGERLRAWMGTRTVDRDGVTGPTVEQEALAACELGAAAVAAVLSRWRDGLRAGEEPAGYCRPGELHPFRHPGTRRVLPPDHLDVGLHAFVGGEHQPETGGWEPPGPVDADLVCLRALWWLAADLVRRGVRHPWLPSTHVDALAHALGLVCGTPAGPDELDRWRGAEAQLQATLTGRPASDVERELRELGLATQTGPAATRRLPFLELRRRLAALDPPNR